MAQRADAPSDAGRVCSLEYAFQSHRNSEGPFISSAQGHVSSLYQSVPCAGHSKVPGKETGCTSVSCVLHCLAQLRARPLTAYHERGCIRAELLWFSIFSSIVCPYSISASIFHTPFLQDPSHQLNPSPFFKHTCYSLNAKWIKKKIQTSLVQPVTYLSKYCWCLYTYTVSCSPSLAFIQNVLINGLQ